MPPVTNPSRKTIEDFLALGEGVRAELVDGEILVNAQPTFDHQHAAMVLGAALRAWAGPRDAGQALGVPVDVYLPSGDVVEPDALFISTPRLTIIDRYVRGVPDLLVEVLSPSNLAHDRVTKLRLYERNAVPEYWIVDLVARAVDLYRLDGGRYRLPVRRDAGAALTSPQLPGFSLPVADLFFR